MIAGFKLDRALRHSQLMLRTFEIRGNDVPDRIVACERCHRGKVDPVS